MAVYYAWALTKYVENHSACNDNYPLICHGDDVWCWDDINEAIKYRFEVWLDYWPIGRLILLVYYSSDGEHQTFDDAEVYASYKSHRRKS